MSTFFDTAAALRRHLTIQHGRYTGQLRQCQPADMSHGLPTCSRCSMQFTTWHSFRYHVQYVCTNMLPQDEASEDHDHRLRVAEFMQYSNAANFQALKSQPNLLAYFLNHCILCGMFQLTQRAMLLHWSSAHSDVFNQHGQALETIQQVYQVSSPCDLCGQKFRQQHHCVILGQAAMCTTSHAPPVKTADSFPTVLFTCEFCRKAYVTRHGLRDHIQKYHATLDVLSPELHVQNTNLQQVFHEAVLNGDTSEILQDSAVLSYLGTTCTLCSKTFAKRNILTRHLRHHHASLWQESEPQAIVMNQYNRPFGKCFCIPATSRVKHICMIFLQICMYKQYLLRSESGQHGYAPGLSGEALPLGPAAVATPQQHAVALLFHGQVDQLYARTDMRLVLTLHCLFCMCTFRTAEALLQHAESAHAGLWEASMATHDFFRWLFFSHSGCLCNPGGVPGYDQHICAPLRQLAMLFIDFGMPICIPYAYRARDLVDLLGPLMTFDGMRQVTTHLMMRQFAKLWQHRELLGVLRTTCLVCQEPTTMSHLQAHLEVAHELPLRRFSYHMAQLAKIFAPLQGDEFACDFCGTSLEVDVIPTGMSIRIMEHLHVCPLLQQFAVLLSHPTWELDWSDFVTWPSQAMLVDQHRRRDMKIWQLNAQTSEHPSAAYLMIAQCGKWYLDDDVMKDLLNHTCMMCGKLYISAWQFLQHLMIEHNFHQMDTEHCHLLLVSLTERSPCDFCGSISHKHSPGKRCIALYNLAVFLCNSYGLLRGRSDGHEPGHRDLEAHSSSTCAAPASVHQGRSGRGRSKKQKTKDERTRERQQVGQPPGGDPTLDSSGLEARRLAQRSNDRSSISVALQHGRGVNTRRSPPSLGGLAKTESEAGASETPLGSHYDGHSGQTVADPGISRQDRCHPDRLRKVQHSECPGDNAVLAVELQIQAAGTHHRQAPHSGGDPEMHQQYSTAHDREGGHNTLPFPEEAGKHPQQSGAVDLDGVSSAQPGTLASDQTLVLSQFMAVGYGQNQASDSTEVSAGTTAQPTTLNKFALRILLNLHGTICFVNAAMLGLAWMAVQCDGMQPAAWALGYALIQKMTRWTPIPLNLQTCHDLLGLLDGQTWGPKHLAKQQDLMDFIFFILPRMKPSFLHCGWVTRPGFLANISDLHLKDEKGSRFQPVQLTLTHHHLSHYSLQTLILDWHDALGLSRAFKEDSACKCLVVDRVVPPQNTKCRQRIDIGDGRVMLPIFEADGQTQLRPYQLCALVFHLGHTTAQGHYRCAVRSATGWFVYDDGRLPDQFETLPDDILQQSCMFWLFSFARNLNTISPTMVDESSVP